MTMDNEKKWEETNLECIDVVLARDDLHALQSAMQVEFLLDFARVASNADGIEGTGATRTICEHTETLALELSGVNIAQHGCQATIETSRVHVATSLCEGHACRDTRLEVGCSKCDKCLFEGLGFQCFGGRKGKELGCRLDRGKFRIRGCRDEVVVQQTGMALLDKFAVRGVEDRVIKVRNFDKGFRVGLAGAVRVSINVFVRMSIGMSIRCGGKFLASGLGTSVFLTESGIRIVERLRVSMDR